MLSLGIDTSGDWASIALVGDALLAEVHEELGRDMLAELVPLIKRVMLMANLDLTAVDLLAVTSGPGSWTGVRVGVATVKALAHVCKTPVVGVNTLDLLASTHAQNDQPIYALVDGGQNTVYAAGYVGGEDFPSRVTPYVRISPTDLADLIKVPTCVVLHPSQDLVNLVGPSTRMLWDDVVVAEPARLGEQVARLGSQMVRTRGPDDLFTLAPEYRLEESGRDRDQFV